MVAVTELRVIHGEMLLPFLAVVLEVMPAFVLG